MGVKIITLVLLVILTGCASASFRITEFDPDGNVIAIHEANYDVTGARQLNKLDMDIKQGKIKLGSSKGDAGDLGTAIMNATEFGLEAIKRIPNVPL